MNVGPIMKRELRAQARQPFTYWLRASAVAVMLAAAVVFGFNSDFKPGQGAELLTYLHGCLFAGIWILVPTMTADCLSRERREGTLSLLFLTNLKPFDIVLAKATAHALRAFSFWLAALPALTLPFLIGGAGWQHAVLSVLFNFMALCLALGAGLLASSRCQAWARACALALFTSAVFWFGFCMVNIFAYASVVVQFTQIPRAEFLADIFRVEAIAAGIALPVGGFNWMAHMSRFAGAQAAWLWVEGGMALASLLFLVVCLRLAARNVASRWRDEPASRLAQWLERRFCTPIVGVNLLRRWMRHTLERNPIGWLEQRTWSGRTMMWTWLAVVTSLYITMFSNLRFSGTTYETLQSFIAWSLALSITFTAAGSFRRERETGVLELLLVSPTSSWQILSGRVRGMWGQFLPALALLFGVWAFLFTFGDRGHSFARLVFYATMLVALPVIGLYFSLAKRSFLSAVLWTLLVGCVLPVVMQVVLAAFLPHSDPPNSFWPGPLFLIQRSGLPSLLRVLEYAAYLVRVGRVDPNLFSNSLLLASVLHAANAINYGFRLHRYLERRQFALGPGGA